MGNSTSSKRHSAAARELEKFVQPTGLYPSCPWDPKMARRLIVDRKIAPRFPGREAPDGSFVHECPICFMYYPGNLNVSTCCKKLICSECFLQMRPPDKPISCPFCNRDGFSVGYSPPTTGELPVSTKPTKHSSRATSSAISIPKTTTEKNDGEMVTQYASVEDRQRLRDSLRSQLSITDQPITNSPHPNSLASLRDATHFLATPSDAARLEELMIMEAIRRSMRDLNVGKESESNAPSSSSSPPSRDDRDHSSSEEESVVDYDIESRSSLDAAHIRLSGSGLGSRRSSRSSNRRDTPRRPQWSPFDD